MKDFFSHLGPGRIAALIGCACLAAAAFFLKFCVPGYSFSALVCLILIAIVLFYTLMPLAAPKFPALTRAVTVAVTVVLILGLLVVGATEAVIIHASFGNLEQPVDYVVVLGAKVNRDGPSVSLWDRICAAYTYLDEHPGVTAVLSGGQGTDEPITEAECMYRWLTERGADPARLRMEPEAANTEENIAFSLDLIEREFDVRPEKLGVISAEYHLLRASLLAKQAGVEAVCYPSRTENRAFFCQMFVREIFGVWYTLLFG